MKAFAQGLLAVLIGCAPMMIAAGCTPAAPTLKMSPAKACLDARNYLRGAVKSTNPETRAAAIEAAAQAIGVSEAPLFVEALGDPEPSVRFAAALAIGETRYAPAKATLLRMAEFKKPDAERDRRVYAGIIYALYRLGDTSHTVDLAEMLDSADDEIRANAVMVMGMMGEPSAIKLLKSVCAREKQSNSGVRIQALEALALLGDTQSARILEASLEGDLPERLIALRTLGHTTAPQGVRRAITILQKVVYDYEHQIVRARVMAVGALGQLGQFDDYGYKLCATSARQPRGVLDAAMKNSPASVTYNVLPVDVISLQQLAVVSLGWLKRPPAVDIIHPLLTKPEVDDSVRVAAAMSILRLLPGHAVEPEPPVVIPAKVCPPVKLTPATKPAPAAPQATEPVATEPVATQPIATQPVAIEPVATQPVQPVELPPVAQPAEQLPATQPVTSEDVEPVKMHSSGWKE